MTPLEPARFADGRPMLLGGLRRTHRFADCPRDIPAQWEAFVRLGGVPGQVGTTTYGAICGASVEAQTMEYMTGVEVESLDALPPGLGRLRVPAAHYAVFVHSGPIADIGRTWDAIWRWLPGSAYESSPSPDFEVYDERYDPATGTGEVEIWVPVSRRASAVGRQQ